MANESEKEQKKQQESQSTVRFYRNSGLILISCYIAAAAYFPFPKLHLPTLLDRVVFTLRWLIVSLLAMYVGIKAVAIRAISDRCYQPTGPERETFYGNT